VVLKSEAETELERASAKLAAALAVGLPEEADLLGPAPMFRVRGRHRRRLLVKSDDREGTVAAIGEAVERLSADRALFKQVAVGVDIDPQ
jgi:primosomal protein N' (replication factor Y)